MDPALQEFYCISRSASQQQPLSLVSTSPLHHPSHPDQYIHRPQSADPDHYYSHHPRSLASSHIRSPFSHPSIAQVTEGASYLGRAQPPHEIELPESDVPRERRERFYTADGPTGSSGRRGSQLSTSSAGVRPPSVHSSQMDILLDNDPPWSRADGNSMDGDEAASQEFSQGMLEQELPDRQEYLEHEHSSAWPLNQPFVIQAQYAKEPPHQPYSAASVHDSGQREEQGGLGMDASEDGDRLEPANEPAQGDQPTPLPILPLFVLTIVVFSEPLTSTILFPFIYFMVRDFHITENGDEIGFFCGLIASSFFLAQFCTSIFWGYMSDKYGRRPILLLGLIGSTITCTLFGLSKSLVWAIASRSMCGLLNGNVGVAKSMLGEIADPSNQGQAFSLFGFAWGIGMIVGPILGSRLSNPAQNFPDIFGHWQFFIEYPYFLPCLVASIGSMIGFLVGLFFLKETKQWPEEGDCQGHKALEKEAGHHHPGNVTYDYLYDIDSCASQQELPKQGDSDGNSIDFTPRASQSESIQQESEIDRLRQEEGWQVQERQPLLEPSSMPQVRFSNGSAPAAAPTRQHYGSMSTLTFDLPSNRARGYDPINAGPAVIFDASSPIGRSDCATIQPRPIQAGSATTGRALQGQLRRHRSTSFQAPTEMSFGSNLIQIDSHGRSWAASATRPENFPTSFSSSYMPSMSSVYHRPSSYIRSISVVSTGHAVAGSRYGDSSAGYADWTRATNTAQRPSTPALIVNDPIIQQRLAATSQIFVLPPDPYNNKDPSQPVQLLVVPTNNPGLSPLSITTIIAYAVLALHSIIFEEVYTLFAVTPLKSHGLGWTVKQLGGSLASMGLVQLTLQFVVYPRLERRYSSVFLFRFAQLLYVVVYMWFPLVRYFLVDESVETGGQTQLVWNVVLLGLVIKYTCSVCSYTAIMVMITNSSPPHLLGTVNGIGQMSASFMRAVGPAVGGIFWAWSISNGLMFPFNYFLVFFLISGVAVLCFVHSLSIPKELSLRRIQ